MCLCCGKKQGLNIQEAVGNVTVDYDALKSTPMDRYLYYQRCCYCIRLRWAAIVICFMCLFWGAAELVIADKYMARIFPERDIVHKCSTIAYRCTVIGLLIAPTVFLIVGIVKRNHNLVGIFVWTTYFFQIIFIVVYIVTLGFLMYRNRVTSRMSFRIIGSILWICLFCYLLMIVNSYRISLWVLCQLMKPNSSADSPC